MMNINKPIFIIGAGRSGTTVLYNNYLALFDDRYIEIHYEDFGNNFRGIMSEVLKFCELSVEGKNYKWQKNLTAKQKRILDGLLVKELEV